MFIYPDNLKAKAALWLWQLRDVAIIGVAFLLSVLALAQTGTMLSLVGTVLYAFLAIQVEGSSVLDFLRRAACFLFLQQQYYEWGQNNEYKGTAVPASAADYPAAHGCHPPDGARFGVRQG